MGPTPPLPPKSWHKNGTPPLSPKSWHRNNPQVQRYPDPPRNNKIVVLSSPISKRRRIQKRTKIIQKSKISKMPSMVIQKPQAIQKSQAIQKPQAQVQNPTPAPVEPVWSIWGDSSGQQQKLVNPYAWGHNI
ncbi:hypothetical protein M758_8G014400 [Ceratodon purpureus]|nr:hypothetical protein M758_8G014400 [Ceratodon purpureus]